MPPPIDAHRVVLADMTQTPNGTVDTCGSKFRSNQLKLKVECNQQDCTAAKYRCPLRSISRYARNPFSEKQKYHILPLDDTVETGSPGTKIE